MYIRKNRWNSNNVLGALILDRTGQVHDFFSLRSQASAGGPVREQLADFLVDRPVQVLGEAGGENGEPGRELLSRGLVHLAGTPSVHCPR